MFRWIQKELSVCLWRSYNIWERQEPDYRLEDLGIFLSTTASRPALGSTKFSPIQWVRGALSLGVKWPRREAHHCPPSSAEVTNAWSYISTPSIHLHVVVLS